MQNKSYEGKTKEEAILKAIEDLGITREELIICSEEEKSSLLKKNYKIEVISYNELIEYIKETLKEIVNLMNINANLEIRRRENTISIKLFSDNNAILIGKNGRTIAALQIIIRSIVQNITKERINILLDVENYKEKRNKNLEYLAKKIAREVSNTKVEAKLDPMNSYERRIVHEALSNNKFVYTESIGEEPNRSIVIKPKN